MTAFAPLYDESSLAHRRSLLVLLVSAITLVATPAHAAEMRCGPGLYAGKRTSCSIANALLRKIGRDSEKIADGRRVAVRSPVTGKTYRFFLSRGDRRSFTCRAYGNGVLSVRILS